MQSHLQKKVFASVISNNGWKKLVRPTVGRGLTAYPKDTSEQRRLGIRYDYDGEVTGKDGIVYHKYQMQPNAGKDIPSTIKNWRDANADTHAVMANVFVKDGTKEDVEYALAEAHKTITGK